MTNNMADRPFYIVSCFKNDQLTFRAELNEFDDDYDIAEKHADMCFKTLGEQVDVVTVFECKPIYSVGHDGIHLDTHSRNEKSITHITASNEDWTPDEKEIAELHKRMEYDQSRKHET